jgi:hypothetical protein
MKFKQFIISMFSDEMGSMSHKRVLATIGALCLFTAFIITKSDHLGDLVFYMTMAFAGLTTIDKFTNK